MRLAKVFISLVAAAALLNGCGGGSGESSPSSSASPSSSGSVGSVAVLMTDAPIDDFDRFWLTVTEISLLSDDGHVSIFSGNERLDLLDLNSHADLFSLADNIPVGHYSKIRMRVSAPLLERLDDTGNVVESVVPLMSGNGKLDLKPSSDLVVLPGETLALQIDLDANKSIHLIQQGNGAYRFRPVVFVDVLTDQIIGKLVRVTGVVADVDEDEDDFKLCRTGMAVESDDDHDDAGSSHDDDDVGSSHDDDYKHCIEVRGNTGTAYFNANGDALNEVMLVEGEPMTVLGYFRSLAHHDIGLDAQVIELGAAGTFQQYTGVVDELDLANNTFTMRDSSDNLLSVAFADVSKFFAMSGEPLTANDLRSGSTVKVDGVLYAVERLIKAAAIFIDTVPPSVEQLTGTISSLHDDMRGFDMSDAVLGDVCVRLNADSNIYQLTLVGDSFSSEAVGFARLQLSQHVEVYGAFNQTGCFIAENILAEAP